MGSKLIGYWDEIRESYWFIPAMMATASLLLSFCLLKLDTELGQQAPDSLAWLYNNQPDGARAVLSTIAGSMITVAGVVFSITLVTVSAAAAQYGPRLLTNFMRDRTNQVTLGMFIATFLYCLMVLRAVQNAPNGASGEEAQFFVPHLSLMFAIVMAVISVAVLIRFIHHIARSIHISHVVSRIGQTLLKSIEDRYPEHDPDEGDHLETPDEKHVVPESLQNLKDDRHTQVCATKPGYIRIIDKSQIVEVAKASDCFVRVIKQPGDFVLPGETLLYTNIDTPLPDPARDKILSAFVLGHSRSPAQDLDFLVEELVEIAARALSPGINDPVTAIGCMNWMATALSALSKRQIPSRIFDDEDDTPRLAMPEITFDSLFASGFRAIVPYAARDKLASRAYVDCLTRLKPMLGKHANSIIDTQLKRFMAVAKDNLHTESYRELKSMSGAG